MYIAHHGSLFSDPILPAFMEHTGFLLLHTPWKKKKKTQKFSQFTLVLIYRLFCELFSFISWKHSRPEQTQREHTKRQHTYKGSQVCRCLDLPSTGDSDFNMWLFQPPVILFIHIWKQRSPFVNFGMAQFGLLQIFCLFSDEIQSIYHSDRIRICAMEMPN